MYYGLNALSNNLIMASRKRLKNPKGVCRMILAGNEIDFNLLEKEIYKKVCELGRKTIKAVLEEWDEELRLNRDNDIYRHKGSRPGSIKTIMGAVEYERAVYEVWEGGIKAGHVRLLDEALGHVAKRRMSGMLSAQIIKASCEGPYRSAARAVSEMTGQAISHTTAWKVVQTLGGQVGEQEKAAARLAAVGDGAGDIETKVLFEEQDGIWLHLQGRSRKDSGPSKEMKVAIAYDGAKKTGKNRYELTNKVACAGFGSAVDFVGRKEGAIAGVYNVDEIEMRILGGDGAGWIRQSQTDETVHFQLDPYHRNKAVLQHVSDPAARKAIMEQLYKNDTDLLMHVIEVEALSAEDEAARGNYEKLLGYYQNNRDGLVAYQRRGLDLPEPPGGKEYRRLGAMESNVFTLIGNRMKGGRCLWSEDGGDNLARFLCLYHTKRLGGCLESLGSCALPERYWEEVTVRMSAAKAPTRDGKGYDGYHQVSVPSSLKWLKDIARIKTVLSSWR